MKKLLVVVALLASPSAAVGQSVLVPHGPEALATVRSFLDYDSGVPIHAEIVATDQALGFSREKVVMTGGGRDRVPGILSIPSGPGPHPVVLLLHAGDGEKESWWADGLERGELVTQPLLEAGFAVLALDGEHHGERAASVDFVPITTWYYDREWWVTFRSMVAETVTDYRRALDYLSSRPDMDLTSVGVVGVSMGGITAIALAAADERVQHVATASAILAPDWLFPLAPTNLVPGLKNHRVLTFAGDRDELVDPAVARLFHDSLDTDDKHLVVFSGGHRPPAEWAQRVVELMLAR